MGASGGSLGYAYADSTCSGLIAADGVTNGYVGIGFDEWGNYSTCS